MNQIVNCIMSNKDLYNLVSYIEKKASFFYSHLHSNRKGMALKALKNHYERFASEKISDELMHFNLKIIIKIAVIVRNQDSKNEIISANNANIISKYETKTGKALLEYLKKGLFPCEFHNYESMLVYAEVNNYLNLTNADFKYRAYNDIYLILSQAHNIEESGLHYILTNKNPDIKKLEHILRYKRIGNGHYGKAYREGYYVIKIHNKWILDNKDKMSISNAHRITELWNNCYRQIHGGIFSYLASSFNKGDSILITPFVESNVSKSQLGRNTESIINIALDDYRRFSNRDIKDAFVDGNFRFREVLDDNTNTIYGLPIDFDESYDERRRSIASKLL